MFCLCAGLGAQDKTATQSQRDENLVKSIDETINEFTQLLKLESWQVFYIDSIYTHDYFALDAELQDLQSRKISNNDLYIAAQDRWMESIYQAMEGVLTKEQFDRYLKSGARKAKKERDKRREKAKK